MINDRIEKLKDEIENTEQNIKDLQITISGLKEVKDQSRFEDKENINNLIEKFESEVDFLNDIKENDEKVLEGL